MSKGTVIDDHLLTATDLGIAAACPVAHVAEVAPMPFRVVEVLQRVGRAIGGATAEPLSGTS